MKDQMDKKRSKNTAICPQGTWMTLQSRALAVNTSLASSQAGKAASPPTPSVPTGFPLR